MASVTPSLKRLRVLAVRGVVQETWQKLGFVFTKEADLTAFGILHPDLLHMDNTVQMHKTVAPTRQWKSVVFK